MNRTSLADAEDGPGTGTDLAAALSTDALALKGYKLDPGEAVPGGLHAHVDQEELFVILAGTATIETYPRTVTATAGELIRFDEGEFHAIRNEADHPLRMIGLGVPPETSDVRLPTRCPSCGGPDRRLETTDGPPRFVCPTCGTAERPAPCPACGGEDLAFELDTDREPVVVCRDCGRRSADPPVRT